MRIKLTLETECGTVGKLLPINYQYPLSSAIYGIIRNSDDEYASFLHEQGYRKENSLKSFKLFTFSDIGTPFRIKNDRLEMKTGKASVIVCFHVPEAASNFIRGLFESQRVEIADKKSRTAFIICGAEVLPNPEFPDNSTEVLLKPVSPMVVGITDEKRRYEFIYPHDSRFVPALLHHWKEKYKVAYGEEVAEADFKNVEIAVRDADQAKARLITVKADTPQETKIRGFTGFRLKVKAPGRVIEFGLDAGVAIYGSMGMGCVEIINKI